MKNIKYALVAVLVACTMISLAAPNTRESRDAKKIVKITYERAIKIPGLVVAMYEQLDPAFLEIDKPIYVVYVSYGLNIFRITGTRAQWVTFFKQKMKFPSYQYEPMGIH